MTSTPSSGNVSKPSFAKIAAMAPPTSANHVTTKPQVDNKMSSPVSDVKPAQRAPNLSFGDFPRGHAAQTTRSKDSMAHLNQAMQHTRIEGKNEQDKDTKSSPEWTPDTSTAEDQQSQVSHASTKQSSVDGKSNASALTFAMDEKESIRPDDSASVQAIDEEGSLLGPPTASSHNGAESSLVRQDEESTKPRPPITHSNIASVPDSEPGNTEHTQIGTAYTASEISSVAAAPDEKLLEAMSVPKDRLLLLNIEQKILEFIQESKDPQTELPLQNSFARLLAHKLADYYNLMHIVGSDNNSVVLYRNPQKRLPPSISMIAGSLTTNAPLPTGSAAVTIMRRAGLPVSKALTNNSTPISSSAPSKATSETGGDTGSDEGLPSPSEGSIPKDKSKMSREEREANYKSVRDRIFGDMVETSAMEPSGTGETSASMSRSSSASGKKKGHRQRVPKDDSFEARSQFKPNTWYPTLTFTNQQQLPAEAIPSQTNFQQGQYPITPGSSAYSMNYGSNAAHAYGPQSLGPTTAFQNGSTYGVRPTIPQYDYREGWSGHQSPQSTVYYNYGTNSHELQGSSPQPAAMPSPVLNQYGQQIATQMPNAQPTWVPQPYQTPYPQAVPYPQNTPMAWSSVPGQMNVGAPSSFGQFPSQANNTAQCSAPQFPHPAGLQGSSFNPQTRSFIPSSGTRSAPNFLPSKSLPFAQPQSNAPIRYGPALDASSSPSRQPPNFSSSPHIASSRNQSSSHPHSSGAAAASPSQEDSLRKKWGTPSHLPKKPPPSEVPSVYDVEKTASLPSQKSFPSIVPPGPKSSGPLVVSGGSGLPMMN